MRRKINKVKLSATELTEMHVINFFYARREISHMREIRITTLVVAQNIGFDWVIS
jgi:hypothetical protein